MCEARTYAFIELRRQTDATGERANIESGSSNDDGSFPALMDLAYCTQRIAGKASRGVAFMRIQKSDEMMRNRAELLRRGSCGTNRHIAIDLARICAYDLGTETSRKRYCEIRFSGRRWSGKNQNTETGVHVSVRGSQRTGKLTERAIKHRLCAR